ncbi:hypothetical protein SAMN05444000_1325 [Shimia gijangensis]|uniref:Uncharacterized protein n=1 Tax=Shimia gijangensis TaxID=1470563 RepID=A0A1M6ST79_9RHOB|nr:hypothetical protein [Shimia gijangensis]SHK47847.1 hypothetical protein SAMN05444000_1325 [Shimia gijangensis]
MVDLSTHSGVNLVTEVKRRIEDGSIDALLFDLTTARFHYQGTRDYPRDVDSNSLIGVVFPIVKFDEDSVSHAATVSLLRELTDSKFKALRDVARCFFGAVIKHTKDRYSASRIKPEVAGQEGE